ncbi:MAG: flagellar export protein FliJ, partial [Thermoguttaceae bacterium]
MPEFRFRLDTLLRVRKSTRDRRRLLLAESQRADDRLQEQLLRLQAERNRLLSDRRQAAGTGAIDVGRLVEAERYDAALRSQEAEIDRQRASLATEIQARREKLLQADREAKALEKLRERQQSRHRGEEERRASKQLDEAAAQTCSSHFAPGF